MDVTEVERKRELATNEAGEPKRPGMTPAEATGAARNAREPEPDPEADEPADGRTAR